MKRVLFVDDERIILKKLKNIFITGNVNYDFINDGSRVMDFMASNKVDLVCLDMHMGPVKGIDLLRKLQETYPNTMRIAMVDFANGRISKDLHEENLVHHTILKPWSDEEIKEDVEKILQTQTSLYEKSMLTFIEKIDALPTLPDIYNTISMQIVNHDSIATISKTIEEDLSLTAFVLKIANSAMYGRSTGNVAQAVMKIGLSNLKDIVLSYSVFNFLGKGKDDLEKIWTKAISVNNLLKMFYEKCLDQEMPDTYGSVGLLHDIGELFLLTYKEKYGCKINLDYPTHENLGGYMLNQWGLPLPYVEGAMFHHRPNDKRIIHKNLILALFVVHDLIEGYDDQKMVELVYNKLGLDKEDVVSSLKEYL